MKTLAEDLFPTAAPLFRAPAPRERREAALHWFVILAGLGLALMVGRRIVAWMDWNL